MWPSVLEPESVLTLDVVIIRGVPLYNYEIEIHYYSTVITNTEHTCTVGYS